MSITWQLGQEDFELAQVDGRILLAPMSSPPLTTLEDPAAGGIDQSKVGAASKYLTVGNYEKKAGVKLGNKPTVNKIMSSGKGAPTRNLFSESGKSIAYTPQEMKLINLQNQWGFVPSAVSAVSSKGGFTIAIPELPVRTLWRGVYLAVDYYQGLEVDMYWIFNKAEVGDRDDITGTDSDVFTGGVTLDFHTDPSVGVPVIFGMCGPGLPALIAANADGSLYPPDTGITVTPATKALTVATGSNHTQQLAVADDNGVDRTAVATYASSDATKVTVSTTGLLTGVATGTGVLVTATYLGFTAVCTCSVT